MNFKTLAAIAVSSIGFSSAWAIDAPGGLVVNVTQFDSVDLSWSAVDGASSYNVYRDNNYVETVQAPSSMYSDSVHGGSYYVTSVNGNSDPIEYSVASDMVYTGSNGVTGCDALPSHSALTAALKSSVAPTGGPSNGGFDLNMWATVVDRDGVVCAVTRSGDHRGDQWPGSRVISAQKANTANSFSLPGLALSTANLWAATQPGGSLFGLQFSNPVDTAVAYGDSSHMGSSASAYGAPGDPMVGGLIGGVNVFGGGLALYDNTGRLIGGIGVSGDTSCADHNISWRTRHALNLDYVPGGVGEAERPDSINYQGASSNTALQNDFSHPVCAIAGNDNVSGISASLPPVQAVQ